MPRRKSLLVASYGLIGLGIGVLIFVTGLFLYGRFAAWVIAQPRALADARMIWPAELPPDLLPTPISRPTRTPLPLPTPSSTPIATSTPKIEIPALIAIPKLGIERAIIPLGRVTRGVQSEWDTDKLFATRDHRDLVGHLEGTANLGQHGNVILTGHNYNRGAYDWWGVFYTLDRLGKGDIVYVTSKNNVRFSYRVVQIEKVNWPPRSPAELLKHVAHLTSTADETLTLVTCGGANFVPFPSRLYVTAKRASDPK